jgi:hypothetical protein
MIKPFHVPMFEILGALLLLSSSILHAATVIEVQRNSELTTVATDGKFARMNISGSEYVIVDYLKQTVNVVNPQKQQVMLLDAAKLASTNNGSLVRTSIQKLGAGIEVAGYPTQKYSYSANGKTCGVIYGSMDVYQKQGIKELFQVMMDKQRAILGGLASLVDDCTLADMRVSDHVKTVGAPMRTDKNGRVETEIKSIKYGVNLPADTFVIPASYKTITLQDQIRSASTGLSGASHHNAEGLPPQAQQMMRQMQQPGQLSPQMMQQMRHSQGMLRQYPPQGY